MPTRRADLGRSAALLLAATAAMAAGPASAATIKLAPGELPAVRKVDPRFQSYNVETVEVIGGRFWAPYPKPGAAAVKPDAQKSGGVDIVGAMFQKREPLDLKHEHRLRVLAKALGPAYVRVSGAWANSTYFHDADTPPPAKPPAGYQGVLTRPQWAGVVDFVKATDSELVASFPVSAGARNPDGSWNPDQARRMIRYTHDLGGKIYAAELINEPNVGPPVGLPKGYDAARFAQDVATFRELVKTDAPDMKTVGPGSTGEAGFILFPPKMGQVPTEALMTADPAPKFDIFSYHFYGTVSKRCSAMDKSAGVSPDQALTEAWLARADQTFDHYKAVRDRFTPGAPIWITEMAEAACGGDRWAATWLDTFRYVDQMGRLAKRGADVIFHNTLSASDYALIDDVTLQPRPSYWAALLWRNLMGETVLDAGPAQPGLHVYAHCLRDQTGGVGLVAINLDKTAPAALELATAAQRYTLTADELQSSTVKLNGRTLGMLPGDKLPPLTPVKAGKGKLTLAPASITFLAVPGAKSKACKAG
jgi:heparanase